MKKKLAIGLCALAISACKQSGESEPKNTDANYEHRLFGAKTLVRDWNSADIYNDLYEGLFTFDASGDPVLAVAASAELTNGTNWRFTISPEAKWSNGDRITAEDFVYGWHYSIQHGYGVDKERFRWVGIVNAEDILDNGAPANVLGIQVIDDYTFTVTFSGSAHIAPSALVHRAFRPIDASLADVIDPEVYVTTFRHSNGAYRISETARSFVQLARNPHYRDDASTSIDSVVYYDFGEPEDAADAVLARLADLVTLAPFEQHGPLQNAFGSNLVSRPALHTGYLRLNLEHEDLADWRVRKALTLAIDREALVSQFYYEYDPAYQFVPPSVHGYTPELPDWAGWPLEERIAEAQRLLASAGYDADNMVTFDWSYHDSNQESTLTRMAVIDGWEASLPVQVNPQYYTEMKFSALYDASIEVDLLPAGWIGDYSHPDNFVGLFTSWSSYNLNGYSNPEFDIVTQLASNSGDNAHYESAARILMEDNPVIPILHKRINILVDMDRITADVSNPEGFILSRHIRFK